MYVCMYVCMYTCLFCYHYSYYFVLYYRTTDLELNKSVESVRAEKSDIQSQFNQYQSELDNLINTERRLKEKYVRIHTIHS